MTITMKLFAAVRDIVGDACRELEVGEDVTPNELWNELVRAHPALAAHRIPMIAINQEYATPDQPLRDGDELAFIPPVSGG